MSLNVQGLGDKIKRTRVFRYLKEKEIDIALLQEVHSIKTKEKIFKSEWRGDIIFSHGESNARGVALLIKQNLAVKVMKINKDDQGRKLDVTLQIDSQEIRLINVYAPNVDDVGFFSSLFENVYQAEEDHVIIAGDLNVLLNPKIDRKGGRTSKSKSRDLINLFLEENDWADVWRHFNPNRFCFTWKGGKPLIMSRLDYMFVPLHTLASVSNIEIMTSVISDHNPICLTLNSQLNLKGPGYWKFNIQHLRDKDFIDEINVMLDNSKTRHELQNPSNKWESVKNDLRRATFELSRRRATQEKIEINSLNVKLKALEKKLHMINVESDKAITQIDKVNTKIDKVKLDLKKKENVKTQGAILRAKARWNSQGEHGSKYFFALEKRNSKNKTITALRGRDGKITKNQGTILDLQSKFYSDLYTTEENFQTNIRDIPNNVVPNELKSELDKELTLEEIQEAIKTMAKNKSPGLSGFSIDIYIIFWGKIKDIFLEEVQFAKLNKILHQSAREGLISLIPKLDRDLLEVKNWRPIVLLDTEFKIIAKALANRLKKALNGIIDRDQSEFVEGRQVSDNLRKILDVIKYYEEEGKPGVFISIDFMKAFDKIEYEAMYKILKCFNFGDYLIDWIKILFTSFKLSVINNGYISENFQATKGLFQGNPIAPYLFVIIIEILANRLRNDRKVKGLKVGNDEILLALFADDLGLFLEPTQENWNNTFTILELFQKQTGMRINYEKTTVFRLGSARETNAKFYSMRKLHWSDRPFKVLGIIVATKNEELIKLNYDPVFEKIETIMRQWKNRDLSLLGKVLIINSLIASLFAYKLAVLPRLPESYIQKYNTVVRDFLWKGSPKISLKTLQSNKLSGGTGLVNLRFKEIAMKAQWVAKTKINAQLRNLRDTLTGTQMGERIWQLKLDKKDVQKMFIKDNFWSELVREWTKLNIETVDCKEKVDNQPLWFNSRIKINNKTVYYEKWDKKGIKKIGDLRDNDGSLLNFDECCNKYVLETNFLEYEGLKKAIPIEWLKIKNVGKEKEIELYKIIENMVKPAKSVYAWLNKDKSHLVDKCMKFNKESDQDLE